MRMSLLYFSITLLLEQLVIGMPDAADSLEECYFYERGSADLSERFTANVTMSICVNGLKDHRSAG
jgi:hypothetical protein